MNDALPDILTRPGRLTIAGAPEGYDAVLLGRFAAARGAVLHVARDDARAARLAEALAFFAPGVEVVVFPAWDCLPYDRVSPHTEIVARRIDALARLATAASPHPGPPRRGEGIIGGRVVIATVASVLQRIPKKSVFAKANFVIAAGERLDVAALQAFLAGNGYARADTVREPGEFALRGGIIDLFPPGAPEPLRLDLFGDEVEKMRAFDPMTQISTTGLDRFLLRPAGEVMLDPVSIERFRSRYRELFGPPSGADPLYEAISAGIRFAGMEHWLPLFHDGLETLFDYVPGAVVTLDPQADEATEARFDLIAEFYDARRTMRGKEAADSGMVYNPIAPGLLTIEREEWGRLLASRPVGAFWPFAPPEGAADTIDAGGRLGRDFAELRMQTGSDLYGAVAEHLRAEAAAGRRAIVAAWSAGSADRLGGVLKEHGLEGKLIAVPGWVEANRLAPSQFGLAALGLEHGFTAPGIAVVGEQDILGDRLVRPAKRRRRAEQFLTEASAIAEGDLVVHVDHGIGRYDGLVTLDVGGAPHDCLRVIYADNDKLFVPVENIDTLSRYGSEVAGAQLDKLGGAAWQGRKARLKKRIRDMAEQLIAVAAQRKLKLGELLTPAEGAFDEFCARFPYAETEDQLRAVEDVLADLASGRPMDRLICGDVGFGKTEVALRAAFIAVMSGKQVAVVVPTTLLARQHHATFSERFAGLPVRIAQLSRMVVAKQAAQTRKDLADGRVDIVVGTHAVLAKSIVFKDLGLVVVDEEQHFGVAHKERLKQLCANVHVLTLTATPIPRTLQLALSGVREMSVIATPPVDRLAVRTFVLPYDGVVLREALLREKYRGGQSFYVCPRIADLDTEAGRLRELVPELKVAIAHGQMTPTALESVMAAFAEGAFDILLATNIIESGLDMPRVNTIIIYRADLFGLGQLYQLRGRVGRGKLRGYAYLTVPPHRTLAQTSERRLEVMQTLDGLGAGFTLASHDLDIRGAGNLLGEEQSGHIREVGIELYQTLLEEAVLAARGEAQAAEAGEWSPQIAIGMAVLIPETYVADLPVRLALYRRLGTLMSRAEVEGFAAELIDRFGPLPPEVQNLLETVAIKILCKAAGIEKVDAGPKGAVLAFRHNTFANPAGLVDFIGKQLGTIKLRPDHRLVIQRPWDEPGLRLKGVAEIVGRLAEVAGKG